MFARIAMLETRAFRRFKRPRPNYMQTYGRDLYMNLTGEAEEVAGINPIRSRGRVDRFISVEEHWSIGVLEISLSSTRF